MHESILGKDDIFKTIHFIHIRFCDCYCGINNSGFHAVTVNVVSVLFFRLSSATYALFDLGKYLEGNCAKSIGLSSMASSGHVGGTTLFGV